jgi:hypothetical protein
MIPLHDFLTLRQFTFHYFSTYAINSQANVSAALQIRVSVRSPRQPSGDTSAACNQQAAR